MRRHTTTALLAAALLAGCGEDKPKRTTEPSDRAAQPPPGWRVVRNEAAGFTISAPRGWRAATKRGATLITSEDKLVAVTIAADRSEPARSAEPAAYARQVIAALPGFEGDVSLKDPEIERSPYQTAIAAGSGTVKTSGVAQRIEVAAFHRPRLVTYSAVIFRNAKAVPVPGRTVVARMLRSFRAQAPGPQRSGRSG